MEEKTQAHYRFYLRSGSTGRGDTVKFSEEESNHMVSSLRMGKGDLVGATDGKGSVFKVFLPQIESADLEVESSAAIIAETGTETVLIAEDEELVLKLMKKTLEKAGYRTITAINGEDAVQKHLRYKNEIDLLFFDVAMPEKDGKQAYEEIRKTDPDVKIIFISGYGELNDPRIRSILNDGKVLLNKPVKTNELLRKIRTVLG